MNPSLALRDASVQDIQLELIRRTRFNNFDGERVVASLLRHRALWLGVLFDHVGESPRYGSALLHVDGLIKLRDLADGIWNVDTLFVLTSNLRTARDLARLLAEDDLKGDITVHDDPDETGAALGTMGEAWGVLTVWWD